jgi:hypothetical protein
MAMDAHKLNSRADARFIRSGVKVDPNVGVRWLLYFGLFTPISALLASHLTIDPAVVATLPSSDRHGIRQPR